VAERSLNWFSVRLTVAAVMTILVVGALVRRIAMSSAAMPFLRTLPPDTANHIGMGTLKMVAQWDKWVAHLLAELERKGALGG
jgi:hypothetical protein